MSEELLIKIYNAFDPKRPLEPDSSFYVTCHEVRGQENICVAPNIRDVCLSR